MSMKKVYCGALFDFHPDARRELIETFEDSHQSTFVSYDASCNSFSFTVDRLNDTATPLFLGHMKAFVEQQQAGPPDPYQSPRLRPLEGTVKQNPIVLENIEAVEQNTGLIALLDSGTSSDDDAESNGAAHFLIRWEPQSGSINIMTKSIIARLTDLMGCLFFPDHGKNCIGISGVNAAQALEKLKNLEKLQVLLHKQDLRESSKAIENLFIHRTATEDGIIEVVRLTTDHQCASRIIVNDPTKTSLDRKCVSQLRELKPDGKTYQPPANIAAPAITNELRAPHIWADWKSKELGSKSKFEALLPPPVSPPPASTAALDTSQLGVLPISPRRFLAPSITLNIENWSKNVTKTEDPNDITVEKPPELAESTKKVTARRVLKVEDSDDEEDQTRPSNTQLAVVEIGESFRSSSAQLAVTAVEDGVDERETKEDQRFKEETPSSESEQRAHGKHWTHVIEQTGAIEGTMAASSPNPVFSVPINDSINKTTSSFDSKPSPIKKLGPRRILKLDDSDGEEDKMMATKQRTAQEVPVKSHQTEMDPSSEASEAKIQYIAGNPKFLQTPMRPTITANVEKIKTDLPASPEKPQEYSSSSYSSSILPTTFEVDTYGARSRGAHAKGRNTRDRGQKRGQTPHIGNSSWRNQVSPSSQATRRRAGGLGRMYSSGQGSPPPRGGPVGTRGPTHERAVLAELDFSPGPSQPVPAPPGYDMMLAYGKSTSNTSELSAVERYPIAVSQNPVIPKEERAAFGQKLTADEMELVSVKDGFAKAMERHSDYSSSSGEATSRSCGSKFDYDALCKARLQELLLQQQRERTSREEQKHIEKKEEEEAGQIDQLGANPDLVAHRSTTPPRTHVMDLKAPKRGKNMKPQNMPESKQERAARLAKVKSEAYGVTTPSKKSTSQSISGSATKQDISKKASLLIGNDSERAEHTVRLKQTEALASSLRPIFEGARAFTGKLHFELQFGQILIPQPPSTNAFQYMRVSDWQKLFIPGSSTAPLPASFTNILTRNGADADRILEMKSTNKASRLWDKSRVNSVVTYEFQCQTRECEIFWLIVNENGSYHIEAAPTTMGMTNLHFPSHVWDACAVISGTPHHSTSSDIDEAAAEFVSQLYIPPALPHVSITYRQPDANQMTIRNLIMKRSSFHQGLALEHSDFALRITEVQTLYHQFHRQDPKLAQGFARDYTRMLNEDRIHYEVSIVHRDINDLLATNSSLELGELTSKWTANSILTQERIMGFLNLTAHVVAKIDGVGALNVGTLLRLEQERMTREPGFGLASAIGSAVPGSRLVAPRSMIPGTRGGRAEVKWMDGKPYYIGYGGALVPIPQEQVGGAGWRGREVAPDDSASQVGDLTKTLKVKGKGQERFAGLKRIEETRGEGFW